MAGLRDALLTLLTAAVAGISHFELCITSQVCWLMCALPAEAAGCRHRAPGCDTGLGLWEVPATHKFGVKLLYPSLIVTEIHSNRPQRLKLGLGNPLPAAASAPSHRSTAFFASQQIWVGVGGPGSCAGDKGGA